MTKLVYHQSRIFTTYPHHPPLYPGTNLPLLKPLHSRNSTPARHRTGDWTCSHSNIQSDEYITSWFIHIFLHMMICFFCKKQHLSAMSFFTPLKTNGCPLRFSMVGVDVYKIVPFLGGRLTVRCRWSHATCNSLMSCSKPKTLSAWRGSNIQWSWLKKTTQIMPLF